MISKHILLLWYGHFHGLTLSVPVIRLPSRVTPQCHSPFSRSAIYLSMNLHVFKASSRNAPFPVSCQALKNPATASACGHQSLLSSSFESYISLNMPPYVLSVPF